MAHTLDLADIAKTYHYESGELESSYDGVALVLLVVLLAVLMVFRYAYFWGTKVVRYVTFYRQR